MFPVQEVLYLYVSRNGTSFNCVSLTLTPQILTHFSSVDSKTQATSSEESKETHLMSMAADPASIPSVHGPLALLTATPAPPSENFQNLSSIDLRAASVLCGQDPKIPATKNHNPVERLKRR
jgi:hypothetical protein